MLEFACFFEIRKAQRNYAELYSIYSLLTTTSLSQSYKVQYMTPAIPVQHSLDTFSMGFVP